MSTSAGIRTHVLLKDLGLTVAYVNCETYNFSPHKTFQIMSCNHKCAKTQIWPFRMNWQNFLSINSHPIPTVRGTDYRQTKSFRKRSLCTIQMHKSLSYSTWSLSVTEYSRDHITVVHVITKNYICNSKQYKCTLTKLSDHKFSYVAVCMHFKHFNITWTLTLT